MIKVLCLVMLVLGIFLAGCTFHYVPSIYPVNPALVPDLKGDQAVCIVNISTVSGEALLGTSAGGYKYKGDLSKWTDTAVDLLKAELEKRGFMIRDCGGEIKEINVSITRAQIEVTMGSRCFLDLYLETGDGYTRTYTSYNSSLAFERASDGAVTRAVTDILNDQKIIEYLQQ